MLPWASTMPSLLQLHIRATILEWSHFVYPCPEVNESQVSRRCLHFKDKHINRVPIQLVWGVGGQCREQSSELGAPSMFFLLYVCSPYLFQGLKCMDSALQKQIINCYFLLLLQRLCISGAQKEEFLLSERTHHTYLKSRLPKWRGALLILLQNSSKRIISIVPVTYCYPQTIQT